MLARSATSTTLPSRVRVAKVGEESAGSAAGRAPIQRTDREHGPVRIGARPGKRLRHQVERASRAGIALTPTRFGQGLGQALLPGENADIRDGAPGEREPGLAAFPTQARQPLQIAVRRHIGALAGIADEGGDGREQDEIVEIRLGQEPVERWRAPSSLGASTRFSASAVRFETSPSSSTMAPCRIPAIGGIVAATCIRSPWRARSSPTSQACAHRSIPRARSSATIACACGLWGPLRPRRNEVAHPPVREPASRFQPESPETARDEMRPCRARRQTARRRRVPPASRAGGSTIFPT